MMRWLSVAALAASLMLAGCFTSAAPLFDPRQGEAMLGAGAIKVTPHDERGDDEAGVLRFQHGAYVAVDDKDNTTISFHRLPGTWPWDGWYVGETRRDEGKGDYMYELYRRRGDKLFVYGAACRDISAAEAGAAHLVRTDSGEECKATRQEDLAQALRLIAKRKPSNNYWTWAPAR